MPRDVEDYAGPYTPNPHAAPYKHRAPYLTDEPAEIRRLIAEYQTLRDETDALPRFELDPRTPTFMATRMKDPNEYDRDMRKAYFVEEARKRGLDRLPGLGEKLRPEFVTPAIENNWRSQTAWAGPESSFAYMGRYMQSFPAAVGHAGQLLANQIGGVTEPTSGKTAVPHPNAWRNFSKNVNNMAFFLDEPMGKNLNHARDMSDLRDARADMNRNRHWSEFLNFDSDYQQKMKEGAPLPDDADDQMLEEMAGRIADPVVSKQILRESNVQDLLGDWGTAALGGTMDFVFDPTSAVTGAYGFARNAGRGLLPAVRGAATNAFPSTGKGLAFDAGLGTLHETIPAAVHTVGQIRKLIEEHNKGMY